MKKNWTGRAYCRYGGAGMVHTGFWPRNFQAGNHVEDLAVDGRLIAKWIEYRTGGTWLD